MSQEEITGGRDGVYSAWHRRLSTRRFVGIEAAQTLGMIDIDAVLFVEYDNDGKQPLVLIETARDVGQRVKPTTVLCALAKRADLPAWVVLYRPSESFNPADHNWPDIESFRVRRVWPHPIKEWTRVTPKEWAQWLVEIRRKAADKLDREEHW